MTLHSVSPVAFLQKDNLHGADDYRIKQVDLLILFSAAKHILTDGALFVAFNHFLYLFPD